MLYDHALMEPGATFEVDVILKSRSETPTEYVKVSLTSEATVAIPQGKSFAQAMVPVGAPQAMTWTPGTLRVDEYRQRLRFVLPANAPPSYLAAGGWCRVAYVVHVHVAIPLWIDRHASFALPVAMPARLPVAGSTQAIVATHPRGPTAGEVYIEAALDATQLRPGDELRGEVSFANVATKHIRRVTIAFVVFEHTTSPAVAMNVVARWAATLVSGPPPEGETFPFRFVVPTRLWPCFDAGIFAVRWQFEVRVDVVLGSDVVLTIPLDVLRVPDGVDMPPQSRRGLPVGRERLARLWSIVAQRLGMSYDEPEAAMLATRGAVSMKLVREAYQGTLGIVAHFRYPHLGLDVHLGARGFLDGMLKRGRFEPNHLVANQRFTIAGREKRQLDAFFDDGLLTDLASATTAELDDDLAHVRVAGAASSAGALENVARAALGMLARLDAAVARIPVPEAMAAHERAWRDFAIAVGGRFEPGRTWIHDAILRGFRFEIGTAWEPHDARALFTVVRVPVEPPLDRAPTVEDAALSSTAREALRGLVALPGFHATTTEMGFVLTTVTPDPAVHLPHVESMITVLAALRGAIATGPFR